MQWNMSFAQLNNLLNMEHELKSLAFVHDVGIIAKEHVCKWCGGLMLMAKQGNIWYWICYCHVSGVKCNQGNFGV